jgi:hypothetical protein
VALVLAPWFTRVHGIEVESSTAVQWIGDLIGALFG